MQITGTKKTYTKVIEYLVQQIRQEKIGKGGKLPTERALSEHLGVSRASIRESYKILSMLGIVENRRGSGSYIKQQLDEWSIEPMMLISRLSGMTDTEIFEFRTMIEIETSTLAAERVTDEEIMQITECFERMKGASSEEEKAMVDKEFHYLIAMASKNHLIINAYNAMLPMMEGVTKEIRAQVLKYNPDDYLEQMHRDIWTAIVSRDKESARKSMMVHMESMCMHYK